MTGKNVRLPVDSYWPNANIVVEYRERQDDLQRALSDARRDELIPTHGIRLVVVTPADHDATPRGRLRRNPDLDLKALVHILQS